MADPTATERSVPPAVHLARAVGSVLGRATPVASPLPGRRASVLIVLYDLNAEPHFVLTKRTDTLEHHPGQVSLPGGRWDPADPDLESTALRETEEELGVDPASLMVVGRLGDVATMVSGFIVAPFVAVSTRPLAPVPSEAEIARVLEVSVRSLMAADAVLPDAADVRSLRYPLLGEDVWGATARILRDFSAVVREALPGVAW